MEGGRVVMSSSVDNRVVQMEFDNASFERGVAQTMRSLEKLDASLNFEKTGAGLSKLTSALDTVTFGGFSTTLDGLKEKATEVFSGITNAATNVAKVVTLTGVGLLGAAVTAATVGGTKRAANIEQARFQIQGLGMDYEALSDDISYAVNGTAFGFDEAAKAAAQFGASGVQAGDDMKMALRGISGVAAMTNSSYDEMSRIFTRVAGNGRVMAIDLNSIAARGVNVAAALGKALGKTEAEIRDMVSKGEIDFATFSKAMDDAFGEHAMKANETFNGAFSNMKAALSRIGADFMTPIRELGRETFLGVRAVIDNIRAGFNQVGTLPMHAGMKVVAPLEEEWSIVSSFVRNMDWAGNTIQSTLEKIASGGRLKTLIGSLLGPADAIFYATRINLEALVRALEKGVNGIDLRGLKEGFDSVTPVLTKFGEWTAAMIPVVTTIFHQFEEILWSLAKTVASIVGPAFSSFFDTFFGGVGEVGNVIINALKDFSQFLVPIKHIIEGFKLTEEQSEALGNVFDFLFGIIGSLGSAIVSLASGGFHFLSGALTTIVPLIGSFASVIASFAGPLLVAVGNSIAFISEKISTLASEIPGVIASFIDFNKVKSILDNLANAIQNAMSGVDLSGVGGFFSSLLSGSQDFSGVAASLTQLWQGALGKVTEVLDRLTAKIEEAGSVIGGFVSMLGELATEVQSYLTGASEPLADSLDEVTDSTKSLGKAIGNEALTPMRNFVGALGDLASNVKVSDVVVAISGAITGIMTALGVKFMKGLSDIPKTLNGILEGFKGFATAVPNLLNGVTGGLNSVKDTLKAYQKEIYAEAIKKIAIAVALLAGSILVLSLVDSSKLGQSLAGVLLLITAVGTLMFAMTQFVKGGSAKETAAMAGGLASMAAVVMSLGISMLMLSAAVAILGHMDPDALVQGVVVVGVALIALAGAARAVNGVEGKLVSLGVCIVGISAGMLVLSASIAILGMLPIANMLIGLAAVVTMLGGLLAMVKTFTISKEEQAQFMQAGISIMAIAAGMLVLSASVALLGLLPRDVLAKGVGGIIGIFAAIKLIVEALDTYEGSLIEAAGAIGIIAVSMIGLSAAIAILGSTQNMVQALVGLSVGLTAIVVALDFVTKNKSTIAAAQIFAVMGAALVGFAAAMAILGSIPWPGIIVGLGAIAGLFLILGVAGVQLAAVSGAIWTLALSVGVLGAGLLGIGVSLVAFAAGLAMLAAIGPAAAESIGVSIETLASHLGNIFASVGEAIVTGITTIAGGIAEHAGELTNSGVMIFGQFLTGLGTMLPQLGEFAVQIILTLLTGITTHIGSIAQKGVEIIVGLIGGLASKIGDIVNVAIMTGVMFIKGLGDGIRNNAEIVGTAVTGLVNSIGSIFLGGLADIVSNIPGFGEEMAGGLRDISGDLGAAAEEASQQVDAKFNETYGSILNSGQGTMFDLSSIISGSSGSLQSAGAGAGDSLSSGFASGFNALPTDVTSTFGNALTNVGAQAGTATTTGNRIGTSLTSGATAGMANLSSNMRGKVQGAVSSAGSVPSYGSGYGVGDNFGSGMYSGVSSWAGAIASRAAQMVRDAKAAANAAQNSASPSKDMMKIGGWFGEGYAIGISNTVGLVMDTATGMVSSAKNSVEESIGSFSDILDGIDWNANPTIRPVLDLSDVESGIRSMGDLFSMTDPIRASAYVGRNYALASSPAGSSTMNTYNISLNWEAGTDANEMVLALGNAIAMRRNMEG